jgi:hypothetical protein
MRFWGKIFGGSSERPTEPAPGQVSGAFANIPELGAAFLLWQIFGDKAEARTWGRPERFDQLAAQYPPDLRAAVKLWCFYYTAWMYRLAFIQKYGNDAAEDMLKGVHAYMSRATAYPEAAELRDLLIFWMKRLDECGNQAMAGPVDIGQQKNVKLPVASFAALTFLALDPDSPTYRKKNVANALSDKLMMTLAMVEDEFKERVREYAQRPMP